MKQRMRLSPKNKVQLSIRIKLIALASIFVLASIASVLYFIFGYNKETIASQEQNFTDRFGFYRNIEASDFSVINENELHQIPIVIIIEHNDLKSKNFGGRLFDASARDLVFVRKGLNAPLKSQIEDYDAAHGLIHATVWIDTLRKGEKPEFDIYYSLAGTRLTPAAANTNNLLISMNEGTAGYYGAERISANASGTFKATGLMGSGRGFSNERGDYLQYNLSHKSVFQQGFTLSAWIFPELKNQHQIICGYRDLAGNELSIGVNKENAIFLKLNSKDKEIQLNAKEHKIGINQWTNLVLAYDVLTKNLKLYSNGNEILSGELNTAIGAPTALSFGRSRQNATDGFTGILDQVELIAEIKNQGWCKFAHANAINPVSQWAYGIAKSPKATKQQREVTRNTIKTEEHNDNQLNSLKFQTQKIRDFSTEYTSTISSSATLMQQKLQHIQQKVRKEELAKN